MKNHLIQSVANSLQVSINPRSVSAAAAGSQKQTIQTALDINLYNPGASTITITQVAFSIPVEFSTDIVVAESSSSTWSLVSANVPGDYLAMPATGSVSIAANSGIDINLSVAVLNQSPGIVNLLAKVYFNEGDPFTQQLPVKIEPIAAAITSFYTTSPGILPGESAALQWNTTGIDYCIITPYDPPGNQLANSSVTVSPNYTTAYTLYAYAGGIELVAQVTVTVTKADGAISLKSGSTKINRGGMVTLIWTSNQYTKSVSINCDDSTIVMPATFDLNGQTTVGPVNSNTNFQLTCVDMDASAPDFQVGVEAMIAPPSVGEITATPNNDIWQGDKVTLSWTNTSVVLATLKGDDGTLLNTTGNSVVVYPNAATTQYTLTAIGANDANGKPMQSNTQTINIDAHQLQILSFYCDEGHILPQESPNQGNFSWVTLGQVASIDNGVGTVNNVSNHTVIAPADGSIYTIAVSTSQTPAVQVKQATTIHNGYGPFKILGATYDPNSDFTTITLESTEGLFALQNRQLDGTLYKVKLTGITYAPSITQGYIYRNNTFGIQRVATINGAATLTIVSIVWQP